MIGIIGGQSPHVQMSETAMDIFEVSWAPKIQPRSQSLFPSSRGIDIYHGKKMKRSEINRQFAPKETKEKKQKAQRGVIEESSRKFPPTNQGISLANAMQFVTTEN